MLDLNIQKNVILIYDHFSSLAFNASITAEKSSSLKPRDLATLYSSFAAAATGVAWETDSANPRASRRSW